MKTSLFFVACFSLCFFTCQAYPTDPQTEIRFSKKHSVFFLDSLTATQAIVTDQEDQFFEEIQVLDMALQMGKTVHLDSVERSDILQDYKSFLKNDVEAFTEDDIQILTKVFNEAFTLSQSLKKGIFPDTVRLIKTSMAHYGPSVYYTREKCIIIPSNVLEVPDYDALLSVMLHEVFHIYSRYQPERRTELYGLIGFEPAPELQFPDSLRLRLLQNPDGVDVHWIIGLEPSPGQTTFVTPLLTASHWQFLPEKDQFFDYLKFNLFAVEKEENQYRVIAKPDGSSTLDFSLIPAYYQKIKDNTQYIIHPDEVLADNFVILVLAEKEPDRINNFSEEGQKLLAKMREVITKS